MTDYRRNFIPGERYFFTVVQTVRAGCLLTGNIDFMVFPVGVPHAVWHGYKTAILCVCRLTYDEKSAFRTHIACAMGR